MWPWVTKKLLKWGNAKNVIFIKNWFCPLFFKKVNFLTTPARSWRCCGQFDIGVKICVWWFHEVELLNQSEELQTNWIFYREHTIEKKWCSCFSVSLLKIQFVLNSTYAFAVILPQQDQFWFLLMLRTSSAEIWQKKLSMKMQICQPPRLGVTKVANERY